MTSPDRGPGHLGPYTLLDKLGEGGMGVVYLGADAQQRRVAVKALRPAIASDPNARRRLAREVETMRRVRSPFVAEILDADVTSDPPYIVTRYVSGRTLDEVVSQGGPLTGAGLARLASGLALALAAVHAAGVVHRDLKPGNVMLANGEPVVIDFGIAQVPDSTRLTQTGMFMGTPGYLAPEVIEGKASGIASDVHSWGATVAFAATARPPFGTGQFETIFYRIINGQPDLDGFPAPLLALVAQALSRDPARRPDTAELCRRTAALDPALLVPAAATATARTAAPPGTVADRSPNVLAPGAAVAPPAGWPPQGRPWEMGAGAAVGAGAAGGLAGAGRGRAPDNYGDVLPPVRYAPAGAGAQAAPGHGRDTSRAAPSRSPLAPLLVVASVAIAIVMSVVLPVAGTVASLLVLMGLRAGDQTVGQLARRRTRRGARPSDALVAAASFPPALAWSALRILLLAPVALVAAGVAMVVTIVAVPHHPIPQACAYGAGTLVAFYAFGPGSDRARRPVRSFFDAVADTPVSVASAVVAVGSVLIMAIAVATAHPPFFWPAGNLTGWLNHFAGVRSLIHDVRDQALRVFGQSS